MTRRCTFLVNALTTGRIALWLAFDQLVIEPDKWYRRRQVIIIRNKKGIVIRKETSKEDISCTMEAAGACTVHRLICLPDNTGKILERVSYNIHSSKIPTTLLRFIIVNKTWVIITLLKTNNSAKKSKNNSFGDCFLETSGIIFID